MTGPRVVKAMADDGVFLLRPRSYERARRARPARCCCRAPSPRSGVATAAFQSPCSSTQTSRSTSRRPVTVAGAFVLRRREPDAPRPHLALAWPWSGLAFLALSAFMTVFAIRERPRESLAGLATLVVGGLAWAVWRRPGNPADRPR